MTATSTTADLAAIGFAPLTVRRPLLQRWIAPALSLAILLAALWQLRDLQFAQLLHDVPRSPLFWLAFSISYLLTPASEWLIYRRLWRLPARGLLPLLRKRVSNEIVLGYSGDLYFYGWARRNAHLVNAPFGAIKDTAILSAAVANVVTVMLTIACWPLLANFSHTVSMRMVVASAILTTLISLFTFAFRRSLLTLPRADLAAISWIHFGRIVATTCATALLWALIMPAAPLVWWLVLAVIRLLVSRLPLLPNKDLVLAGLIAFAVGNSQAVTAMLTMLAGLLLVTHLVLGAGLALWELTGAEERR